MSGTGASASRANADGSTSFSSRAAMRVGQNPKAAASSQRAGRDSRATDFIRPLLGKRPPIAVQPPSTMPSLLTMRPPRVDEPLLLPPEALPGRAANPSFGRRHG